MLMENGVAAARRGAAREACVETNDAMARDGLRVLALASGPVADATESAVQRLTFVGLVGFADPPAEGVKDAIVRLRAAGLRTVMLTGDQRATAAAVGRELNLLSDGQAIIDGRELDTLSDERVDCQAVADAAPSAASRRSTSCGSCRLFRREATSSPCSATA